MESYIKCGDCIELMKDIPDKSIDMILCDLPYGTTRLKWDSPIPLESLWNGYSRVIKDNGAIVLFGDGMFSAKVMISNPKMWRYNLIWRKPQGTDFLNSNRKPLKCHEDIMVFYKKQPTYNPQFNQGTPYSIKSGRKSDLWGDCHSVVTDCSDGKRYPLTVIDFYTTGINGKKYPAQKPIPLLEWLVKTYTNEGEMVLDNCMGVGSTCIACQNTNRKFIGFEIDKERFDIAKELIYKGG